MTPETDDQKRLRARIDRAKSAISRLIERVDDHPNVEAFFDAVRSRARDVGAVLLVERMVSLHGYFEGDEFRDGNRVFTAPFDAAPVLVVIGGSVGVFHVMCTHDCSYAAIRDRAADLIDITELDMMAIEAGFQRLALAATGELQ
ncbi:hypothetical protein GC169_03060 [bacterium]|nr:hypothetical protein [bacterium]